jgi:hypothetical protein
MPTERPRLVGEVVPTFADRGCCVVSATDPHPRSLVSLLDRSRYFFFQVAPRLSSRGWVDPVPDPLLLRKSGSAGNRTQDLWICSQKLWPLDHRVGVYLLIFLTSALDGNEWSVSHTLVTSTPVTHWAGCAPRPVCMRWRRGPLALTRNRTVIPRTFSP